MTSPYTMQPLDALMAAQSSVGMALTAAVWFRRLRPLLAALLLLAAIWIAVLVPVVRESLVGLGVAPGPQFLQNSLRASALCALLAAAASRKIAFGVLTGLGVVALWWLTGYLRNSDYELAAAHLAFFGLLVGAAWRFERASPASSSDGSLPSSSAPSPAPPPDPPRGRWRVMLAKIPVDDDIVLFFAATALAACVSVCVLGRFTNSGDEVANTFEAALFAKLRPYGQAPPCAEAFRMFWVFEAGGRLFPQYTPGWPLFMTPFFAVGTVWMAAPVALGLLVVAVARIARRAALGGDSLPTPERARIARACGLAAGVATALSTTMLINGGSRYPHVFVAATYAWSLEALCAVSDEARSSRRWSVLLGFTSALLLAARPADGATLGVGLFAYFVYAVARKRIALLAVFTTLVSFALVAALTLIILRLQIGRWFTTGYQLTGAIYPWAKATFSAPGPDEWKWGFPLATGSYSWWPASPALGLAGLATVRGRARRIAFMLLASYVPFLTLYSFSALGRGFELGYGPRYTLPLIVPMAVGTGLVLGAISGAAFERLRTRIALHARGPATLAAVAVVLGVARIAPLVYPYNYADVHGHNRFRLALERAHLHNAVVFVSNGLVNTDPMDLTENLPLDLYPEQDVLVALWRSEDLTKCVREQYPSRRFLRAVPGDEIHLVPF
ncbi:MAG: hypothetical protein M3O50_09540 [Myxococcota bacterium]|nr:hypothetical protein [Myxococcota bacterium]